MKLPVFFLIMTPVIAVALLGYQRSSPEQTLQVPALQVQTTTGAMITLGGSSGQPMLVNFWATSCKTCLKEIPHLIEMYHQLHARGLQIIGVSVAYDPPIQVVDMIREKNIPYPVVFDLDKKIQHAFGMQKTVTPATILLDAQGRIVLQKLGIPDINVLYQQINTLLVSSSS